MLLFIPTTTYSQKAPVMVGFKIIDRVMVMIMKGELVSAAAAWKQAHFSAVMSGSLQLPHRSARGMGMLQGAAPSAAPNPTVPKEFSLHDV